MRRIKRVLSLFAEFFRFGCFTFGGGWGIVAQMRELYVEQRHTLTEEELLDLTSVGRSIPGIMIGNISILYGYREERIWGGIACLIGMSIPPVCILIVVTHFYSLLQDNIWIAAAMAGVRAAVVPLVVSATLGMLKPALSLPPCCLVMLLTLILYLFFEVSGVWLVVIGMICGFLMSEYYEKESGRDR